MVYLKYILIGCITAFFFGLLGALFNPVTEVSESVVLFFSLTLALMITDLILYGIKKGGKKK